MTLAAAGIPRNKRGRVVGNPKPRISPPTPARTAIASFEKTATELGIELMPWQREAARFITALGERDKWLFPEVALIVARQNGKTRELVPLIVNRLLGRQRIMHTAQNRELPREVFGEVADIMWAQHRSLLRRRPRFANGQEEIRTTEGGVYRIVAPTRGGARGPSNDLVIVDELREMNDYDFIKAAKPTLTASPRPQILYLSNAGTDDSVVLNDLRKRADQDPRLAYLEWSAAPERKDDDRAGWVEANPAIGHLPEMLEYLEGEHESNRLAGTMEIFETEHLCRWVVTLLPAIVEPALWADGKATLERARRPVLGISLDAGGTRASAVAAWQQSDGNFAVSLVADVTGDPIDLGLLGPELKAAAIGLGVSRVVYDPYDEQLARYFGKAQPMNGRDFANACGVFVRAIERKRIRWSAAEMIGDDLAYTTKRHIGVGAWMAVKAREDRPITAALAAIRAVGSVAGPTPGTARIV